MKSCTTTSHPQPICIHDLAFDYMQVPRFDAKGVPLPIRRLVEVGVPRIPNDLLRTVFFLYPSLDAAKAGDAAGGTGFFVQYGRPPRFYAVTNYHVAVRSTNGSGNPVIRFSTRNGECKFIELDVSDWEFIPNGPDVAAVELDRAYLQENDLRPLGSDLFALPRDIQHDNIGPGEDVFMIGRFLDIKVDTNVPSVRFGNISTMPVPLVQPNGAEGNCYTIDMHSRSGFSGSPVFAYRTFGQDLVGGIEQRTRVQLDERQFRIEYRPVFRLLGIHCAQFTEQNDIHRRSVPESATKEFVLGLSGMTIVVPAWDIKRVLDIPKFAEARRPGEEELQRTVAKMIEDDGKASKDGRTRG